MASKPFPHASACPTYSAASYYYHISQPTSADSAYSGSVAANAAQFRIGRSTGGSGTTPYFDYCATIMIYNPADTNFYTKIATLGTAGNDTFTCQASGSGAWWDTTAVTAFRLKGESSNVDLAKVSLFGLNRS